MILNCIVVANGINDIQLIFEIQNYAADTFYTVHFGFDFFHCRTLFSVHNTHIVYDEYITHLQ